MIRSVTATRCECRSPLPGDDVVPLAVATMTHAVTIDAPRSQVWPWLVQMGAARGGWYSYDAIDNGGHPSAVEILPQFQEIRIGTLFPAFPGATDAFVVVKLHPEHWLVLAAPDGMNGYRVSWAFTLEDQGPARTRLIVRVRGAAGYTFLGLPEWVSIPVARIVHPVMQRKQLIGLVDRIEGRAVQRGLAA